MKLSECSPGEGGTVREVTGTGPVIQRILEMGIIEGTDVRVIRVAPLGDPVEIEVQGYLLSLRRTEAESVEVEVAP